MPAPTKPSGKAGSDSSQALPLEKRAPRDDLTALREESAANLQSIRENSENLVSSADRAASNLLDQVQTAATGIEDVAKAVWHESDVAQAALRDSENNFDSQRMLVLIPWIVLSGLSLTLYAEFVPSASLLGDVVVGVVLTLAGVSTYAVSLWLSRPVERTIPATYAHVIDIRQVVSPTPSPLSERLINRGVVTAFSESLKRLATQTAAAARIVLPKANALYEAVERSERQRSFVSQVRLMQIRFNFPPAPQIEGYLRRFAEATDSEELWLQGVVACFKRFQSVPETLIKLFFYESTADERSIRVQWQIVRSDTELIEELVTWLVSTRCIQTSEPLDPQVAATLLGVTLRASETTFSLDSTRASFDENALRLIQISSAVENLNREFRLGLVRVNSLAGFNPTSSRNIERAYLNATARANPSVPQDVLTFLYASVIGGPALAEAFDGAKHSPTLARSLELLRNRGILRDTLGTDYLVAIAVSQTEFSIARLQQMSVAYEDLREFTRTFHGFLRRNELAQSNEPPSISTILSACPPSDKSSTDDQLILLAQTMISSDRSRFAHSSIALASLTFFLRESHHRETESFCRRTVHDETACRLLYDYIGLLDAKSLEVPRPPLAGVLQLTDLGSPPDEHYEDFQFQLTQGYLFTSRRNLISHRLETIRQEIREEHQEIRELKESVAGVLESRLDFDAIDDLLLSNALAAYIVTVPTTMKDPIMDFLGSEELRSIKLDSEQASGDTGSRSLVILDRNPGGSGRGTRVGLVPQGVTFEKFSDLFDKALSKAVVPYNRRTGANLPERISLYVMRVLPAGEAMYVTGLHRPAEPDSTGEETTRPELTIKKLILDELTSDEQIDLLGATVRGQSQSVAVKQIVRMLYESPRTSIVGLVRNRIAPDLQRFQKLANLDVQRRITDAFTGGNSLVQACIQLCDQERRLGPGKSKKEFLQRVRPALPRELQNDAESEDRVVSVLYRFAKGVGDTYSLAST